MKQLEHEKDALQQGLRAIERAKDWYQQRISAVQEKIQQAGKCHATPVSTDIFGNTLHKPNRRSVVHCML